MLDLIFVFISFLILNKKLELGLSNIADTGSLHEQFLLILLGINKDNICPVTIRYTVVSSNHNNLLMSKYQ